MEALSIIQPKRPKGIGWTKFKGVVPSLEGTGFPYESWTHRESGIKVISSVEVAAEKVGVPALGPAFHISISQNGGRGGRCTSAMALWVLDQFDCTDALEDNHVPSGFVRNFWRYVADNLSGMECPCTETEPAIREDKGDFVWRGAPS